MGDDTDAFGRKKDETGLGDLGWGATGQPPPTQPTVSSTGSDFQTVTPQTTGLGSTRRNPLIFVVQFLVVAGIAAGVYVAATGGSDDPVSRAVNPIPESVRGSGGGGGGGGGSDNPEDSKVPEQVKSRDLFTAGGFRAALRILEKEQPGRITNFSMRRDRINLQVVRGGKTHVINFNADAEVPEDISATTTSSSTIPTFSYEELNTGAPERLMKAANSRLKKSKADVEYFVAQKWTGSMQWGIYYQGGSPIAQGDSRGRYTRQIS
jgi:hypothetical protein